jgi:antitoxin MazE
MKMNDIYMETVKREPRDEWEERYKEMRRLNEDSLIMSDSIDLDFRDWEW